MGLVEKAVAKATGQTEFEILTAKIENLKAEKARLEAKAQAELERVATALVEGTETPVLSATIERQIRAIDLAIARLENQRRAAEPAYLRHKMQELQAEMEALSRKYQVELEEFEKARRAFDEAEKRWLHFSQVEHYPRMERLRNQYYELERRLQELEGGDAA